VARLFGAPIEAIFEPDAGGVNMSHVSRWHRSGPSE
jgi:hypothetical protein